MGVVGALFGFSDTWQLVINTGTTIVTFLMVFLIQNSQNRDSAAIQVKLDELIRVSVAHNSFVGIEHLTDDELEDIRTRCEQRALAEKAGDATVREADRKEPIRPRTRPPVSSPLSAVASRSFNHHFEIRAGNDEASAAVHIGFL